MERLRAILRRILRPPLPVMIVLPIFATFGLVYVFSSDIDGGAAAYIIYALSAYSLVILSIGLPGVIRRGRARFRTAISGESAIAKLANRYFTDKSFKGDVRLYRGALIDALYTAFRIITGIIFSSVWFISLAAYHLFLGFLRLFLILCRKREKTLADGRIFEYNCYRAVGWSLFILDLPMCGMTVLMVLTNSGFEYPGYIIYVSAMYTFWKAITAAYGLSKFRKEQSPLLSSIGVVNLVAAMMSVLGLQTAMIAAFSDGQDAFRFTMNAVTGGVVTAGVIVIAIYMIANAGKRIKEIRVCKDDWDEQIGEQIL